MLACNSENTEAGEHSSTNLSSSSKYYTELPFDKNLLEDGDIILRRGSGMLSNYIITKLNDSLPISHCGIITKQGKDVYVIHSILSEEKNIRGITKENIYEFIEEGLLNSLVIVRPKKSMEFKTKFVAKAHEMLAQKIPFDPLFDIRSPEKMYCTEIIWNISKELLGEDIFDKKVAAANTELLGFDNFFNTQHFEIVFSDFE